MMNFPIFFTFFVSLAISMGSLPLLRRMADRFGLFDQPGERHVHTMPVSRLGGIAISVGALVPILIWLPMSRTVYAYLAGALIILSLGIWDDLAPLNFKTKFAVQLLATATVVFIGGITLEHLFFQVETLIPQWMTTLLTILFFIGVTNAVNLSDGLDGLAGGLCLLSFGGFALFGYLAGEAVPMVIAISMMGAIYGFLRFNTYPANIFMGDGGSQFLGFSLGTLATMQTQSGHGDYNMALSLLILGLPVVDTVGVLIQRCLSGKSPFIADNKHIHHKLLTTGFFHSEAVIIIYTLQWVMLSFAYLFRMEEDAVVWGTYALFTLPLFLLFILSAFSCLDWCRLKRDRRRSILRPIKWWIKKRQWAMEKPAQFLEGGLFLYLTLGVFIPRDVSFDMSIAAGALFVLMLLGMTFLRRVAPFIIRLGLYIGSTFIVYLSMRASILTNAPIQTVLNLFYLLTAFLVIVNVIIQLSGEHPFQITPLDCLIIFMSILASTLLEVKVGGAGVGWFVAKLITLFIAYELILNRFSEEIYRFGFLLLWVFLALGARGWIA